METKKRKYICYMYSYKVTNTIQIVSHQLNEYGVRVLMLSDVQTWSFASNGRKFFRFILSFLLSFQHALHRINHPYVSWLTIEQREEEATNLFHVAIYRERAEAV